MKAHLDELSEREISVLIRIADGKSDREISIDLDLSCDQVSYASRQAQAKLRASSRAHAVAKAIKREIIDISD